MLHPLLTEVSPIGVRTRYERNFPPPFPPFDLFLAGDGRPHIGRCLVPHELVDVVPAREPWNRLLLVLGYAAHKVVGDAGVQSPADVCHHVDVVLTHWSGYEMLRCAQHDTNLALSP